MARKSVRPSLHVGLIVVVSFVFRSLLYSLIVCARVFDTVVPKPAGAADRVSSGNSLH